MHGQYLLVHAVDDGLYCYSLIDLYNPRKVDFFKFDKYSPGGKYIFIEKRNENIFNGISASCGNWDEEIDFDILFHGFRLELDNNDSLVYKISSNKMLVLNQFDQETSINELIIDLKEGEIKKGLIE